ncbi:unnamed protein product [Euphydryas editha]|uniref:Uncharacterized protein n=1 Tax=Euphydryas editha TaxID=104508 RepID=A0AAU9VBD7_EUPED|nr:unnamed protein product [Euphydryas editha]
MDDLYDNLENYNDVNIVNELKSENKELKLKLEEYSKAIAQLQKDFDKVNGEYKKLEINYSSLLKTARAEIQRKTDMINNLNLEKDMIILNTMKKTGKNFLNIAKSQLYSKGRADKNESNTDTIAMKEKQNKEAPLEVNIQKDNRVDSGQTSSVDTVSGINTETNSICSEEKAEKVLNSCEKNKNKENLPSVHQKDSVSQSNENDTNRNLSTPVNRFHEAKFSSDEDSEIKLSEDFRKSPLRNDVQYYEWQHNKDNRTDHHENYETSKEFFKSRSSRYTSIEKYKKYESFPRHRRHYGPERSKHRYTKDYTEYTERYPSRGDYGRQRSLRSPPSDKYNRSKSRDRRFAYERDNYLDYDKHSSRFNEHGAAKHKIRNELDEPSFKRQRNDSYSKYIEEISYINEREREFAEQQRVHITKPQEYALPQSSSCQSPDYIVIDSTFPEHSVKEIMSTAATKLEDPRNSSKKYILSLSNNTSILSTVVGRNIDLKMVDKSVWGIEKIGVPAALTYRISEQESDNLLKDIYMNIENPALHDSLESGEIQSHDEDLATFYSREIDKSDENETNSEHKNTDFETRKHTDVKEKDKNISEKFEITKYKIPKIKKPDKTYKENNSDDQKIQDTRDKNNLPVSRNVIVDVEKYQPCEQNIKQDSDKLSVEKEASENNAIENLKQIDSDKRKQEIIKTIEGDLELSDEASDVEFDKDTDQLLSKNESNIVLNVEKDDKISPSSKKDNKSAETTLQSEKTSTKNIDTTKSSSKKGLTKDSSKEKKRKRKRKTSEQNEIKESHDAKKTKEREFKESFSKDKKEKDSISKQTLNKFSDLFGDSSSLITPDDLGINNIPAQSAEKYTSIFENTQDAVDLTGEVIIKTVTSPAKVDTFNTSNSAFSTVLEKAGDKNHYSVNVTVVNDNIDNNAEAKNAISNNTYQNTKSELSINETNIVKTVIISSGKQPECVSESRLKDTSSNNGPSITALSSIKALATSTPQKCIDTVASTEEVDASSKLSNSSNVQNTDEHQNETDIPDVRVFVRRRRKLAKKAN